MLNKMMDVLTARRMMSIGNLALQFDVEPEELQPHLDQLEAEGRIRYALSRCSGSCSTCSTCTSSSSGEAPETPPPVDPTAIVISLELRKEDA